MKVLVGKQATQKAIEAELTKFEQQGTQDGVVFIGLFGHGIQYGNDAYYCPYDVKVRKVTDATGKTQFDDNGKPRLEPDPQFMTSMGRLLEALNTAGAGNRILIADCCREDPSAARGLKGRAFGSSVKISDLEPGTAAIFSCSNTEQAFEHDDWKHGAFTKAFLDYCSTLGEGSDATVSTMTTPLFRSVESMVKAKEAGKTQRVNPITNGIVDLKIDLKSTTPTEITNSIGMKLKLIPAGEFLMGSSDADVAAALKADSNLNEENFSVERPQHRVKISRPFYAGVFEVTQGEFEAVMGMNPSYFSASGGGSEKVGGMNTKRFPVETVTWHDAVEFCNKLSQQENLRPYYSLTSVETEDGHIKSATVSLANGGRQSPDTSGYRLPTEAEWEYLCRAGTTSAYNFGNVLNGDKANVDGNYPFGTTTEGSYLEHPTNVGSYSVNRFGLHDVHGNVWEWCVDVYDESAYGSRSGTTTDPISESGSEYRVLRGGSWGDNSRNARSADRDGNLPGDRFDSVGFRVVR